MTTAGGAQVPSTAVSTVRGKAQRELVPRTAHADLADRPEGFDAVSVLKAQAEGRVEDLLQLRYERMAADTFSFLRGAAAIMAADLSFGPSTDLTVQLCGDAHLSNFGVFMSPERRLVFDINDFDETHPGPFEWDLKRLAASVAVAGDCLNLTRGAQERAAIGSVRVYREAMRRFARASTLDVWYAHLDVEDALKELGGWLSDEAARHTQSVLERARSRHARRAYDRLITETDEGPRIRSDPPLLVPMRDLAEPVNAATAYGFLVDVLRGYESTLPLDRRHLLHQFTPIDAARKVVGVGSVGTRCFAVLLLGRDGDDPFFLQIKEAAASVLEPYLGPSKFPTAGQRVVVGQQLIQATPDEFLGWLDAPDERGADRPFYVRQLFDGKASAEVSSFNASLLCSYAQVCGWTLARAHARSGDRFAISSYLGKSDAFDRAIASFALAYVARNHADHTALTDAIASGRVAATET
ncbi:MAG TPA: DUF2252 domain-containing protein [Acidimicrobiales bacterium]|jgi:uncharacterized protein (DUF2252 family)|nr:DUF2252 domain-containing protein [Acidimicrobiales bacterium]